MRVSLTLAALPLAVLGLTLATGLDPAVAGAFDGKWVADIPAQDHCNTISTMTMVVAGKDISGEVHNPANVAPFTGKVEADGTATFSVEGRFPGTMTFSGDHFDATWFNGACDRHAQGDRALDEQQQAIAAARRKQHQDALADLIRRAELGDKTVDYGALRAEAVYGENWEFYGNGSRGLLDQANASVKGKDCVTAMVKLDAVIKRDFTVDAAHDLKAECLRQMGEPDKARIESDIAKGLIHSLMDSGNGKTEKTAYVVSTLREEQDVLANRRIQVKTRATELRGADGRYFDLVHGISIVDGIGPYGGNHVDVSAKDVYFDITSFVNGRASHRAAVQVANATVK